MCKYQSYLLTEISVTNYSTPELYMTNNRMYMCKYQSYLVTEISVTNYSKPELSVTHNGMYTCVSELFDNIISVINNNKPESYLINDRMYTVLYMCKYPNNLVTEISVTNNDEPESFLTESGIIFFFTCSVFNVIKQIKQFRLCVLQLKAMFSVFPFAFCYPWLSRLLGNVL